MKKYTEIKDISNLQENGIANYACSFKVEGVGLQNINSRIKPANKIIQELYPELVKWAD